MAYSYIKQIGINKYSNFNTYSDKEYIYLCDFHTSLNLALSVMNYH